MSKTGTLTLSMADIQTIWECADAEFGATDHPGRREAIGRIQEACDNATAGYFD